MAGYPWLLKLVGYDYIVEYKKGVKNKVVDALSRRDEEAIEDANTIYRAVSIVEPKWLTEVKQMMEQSSFFQELQKKADQGILSTSKYKKLNGILFYKGRVLLDPTSELCRTIFHDHHAALGAGHSGYHRTPHRIKLSF